ncbi:hypothetical protein OG233_15580 [Streptomyces sp. NBC_01218]|uniref:hypothetical protein n=1 Tax=unclassified Streptomyces TaxID=2593676 RepID=UPI0023BA392E|nr:MULTISPECIES: hypothetical protein [unclassified Streptomyces]WEH40744.1 hypothetical protein PZB77_15230 [Streptomyces sp. AM 2-1-1]WSQ52476.1 hypothetical protein OG233_15580 [Streptomyces sp. NBC_01218]
MKRQIGRGVRAASAAVAAMGATLALSGPAYASGPVPYAFDPDAERVTGTVANTDAPVLDAGSVHRSSIGPGEKLYYRVNLDATSNAYVSAVAVPKSADAKVAYGDGITVSIRDRNDSRCGTQDVSVGSAEFARPISAYASRTIGEASPFCQEAGAYDVLIERTSKETSTPEVWELEIRHDVEPALKEAGSQPTTPPTAFASEPPAPLPTSAPRAARAGGTGFNDATGLEPGEWKDTLTPGGTRFYRVPVDWGQQLFVTAELSNNDASTTFLGNALSLSLANPARGHVDGAVLSYSGRPASVALDPLPPVGWSNRYSSANDVSAVRFAGWYYVAVGLSPAVAKEYGDGPLKLTLTVQVRNAAQASPYAGAAGIFGVSDGDRDMARSGLSGPRAGRSGTLRLVGVAGIGTGTVLVLGLGVWTLLARRKPVAAAPEGPGGRPPAYGGPPRAW